ncbi:class I SAM-dependent methyltransferase [Dysgonomonas sp. Marseille-P4361]|uniref:class I SAM-dependent methyltransferase n=1 Tax=Dysgonomonas sp. Marseille-P4361 TaxID=2161820 RepID=UPI000D558394|nr:class I SAM-dependent methyltransferase [Dysgonomonas sp. Marseille-P4361]
MAEISNIYINICPVCGSMNSTHFLECKDYLASKETFEIEKCQSCGFAFTQNFPSEKAIGRYYEAPEYVSHSDTQKGIINRLYHIARKVALKSKAKIVKKYTTKKSGLLLDIGSGTGYFLNKMREKKWVVTGIEKSEDARLFAKQKFNIDCQDSEYLYNISPKTKDVISMWHVLEHLEHLNTVMEHLRKILKDDGTLIIALPNKSSFDAEFYKEYWAAYDVPRHLWHFSPDDFKYLIERHQFELIDTKPMHFDTFYISMLSEKNKGTTLGSLVGLVRGGIFFLKSLNNKKRSSSLTYILKKKQ